MLDRYTLSVGDPPRYNIARGQLAPVELATREIRTLRWGLLRRWRGHGGKRGPMIHTAGLTETDAMPLLRDARAKARCAVLVDGVYDRIAGHPVWRSAGHALALPGIWSTDDDQPSFAVLTNPGDEPIAVDRDAWLARGELIVADVAWRTIRISTWARDATHDDPRCIAPLGNPAQGELF